MSFLLSNCLRHTRHRAHQCINQSMENRSQIDQKSMKNLPKSSPNRSQIIKNQIPRPTWGGPGAILAPSAHQTSKRWFVGPPLDPPRTPFGGHFGPSWALGGDFWGKLSRKLVLSNLAPLSGRLHGFEVSGCQVGASWLSFGWFWGRLGIILEVGKRMNNLIGKRSCETARHGGAGALKD